MSAILTRMQPLATVQPAPVDGAFLLEDLPYGIADLEPVIDAETMALHHDKHHRAYVDGLNLALKSAPDLAGRDIEHVLSYTGSAPAEFRKAIHDMAGGHLNHTFFWRCMSARRGGNIPSPLTKALAAAFGSVDNFMQQFSAAGTRQFGSGWVSLCINRSDEPRLEITTFANQDTWIGSTRRALLICDVWEHAYYLRYRNRRADWLEHWWQVVDWDAVQTRFEQET